MKTYELLLVLDNAISDEAKDATVKKFEDVIVKAGGNVLSTDKWGARKLAYVINYKTDGYYVLVTFEADGASVKELDRVAGLTAEVLRRLITVKTFTAPAQEPAKKPAQAQVEAAPEATAKEEVVAVEEKEEAAAPAPEAVAEVKAEDKAE